MKKSITVDGVEFEFDFTSHKIRKTTDRIIRRLKFYLDLEYSEIRSECYLEFYRILKVQANKINSSENPENEYSRKDINFINMMYYRYGEKNVYNTFKKQDMIVKMPKTEYEKYRKQENVKDKLFTNNEKVNIKDEISPIKTQSLYIHDKESDDFEEYIEDEKAIENFDYELLLGLIKDILTEDEFDIFYKRVILKKTYKEIGKKLNLTKQAIDLRYKNIINKLRKQLRWEE